MIRVPRTSYAIGLLCLGLGSFFTANNPVHAQRTRAQVGCAECAQSGRPCTTHCDTPPVVPVPSPRGVQPFTNPGQANFPPILNPSQVFPGQPATPQPNTDPSVAPSTEPTPIGNLTPSGQVPAVDSSLANNQIARVGVGRGGGVRSGLDSGAPNLIGDSFGLGGQESAIAVDRMFLLGNDIDTLSNDANSPIFGSESTLTAFRAPTDFGAVNFQAQLRSGGGLGPLTLISGTSIPAEFTTQDIAGNVVPLNSAFEIIPILRPAAAADSFADTTFRSLNTVDGTTVYVASESAAYNHSTIASVPDLSGNLFDAAYVYDYLVAIRAPSPGSGGTVGRVQITDNNSARPRTRLWANLHYFNNVPLSENTDVRRFTPGYEHAFVGPNGVLSSISVRAPMAITLNSNFVQGGVNDTSATEFGNLTFVTKTALYTSQSFVFSAGMSISLPTADDLTVSSLSGNTLVNVDNQSVHVTPYIAALWTPNDTVYGHFFYQFDFDTNGSPTFIDGDLDGTPEFAGRWHDPTLMIANAGLGAWMVKNNNTSGLTGVALTGELHYTSNVQDPDSVQLGNFVVGDPTASVDIINSTVGAHFRIGQKNTVSLGYSAPLTSDRVFDGEARLIFERSFGGPTQLAGGGQ